jgi:ATP-dependent Clp endopeptidase proteolytic subunit ClpP
VSKEVSKILKCFEIKNATETSADLYFYGDIVSDWWGAWQEEDQYPEAIKNFLSGNTGKTLNVYINSGGGSVFAGIAIYNMLKRHNAQVNVYVDGLAASIASVIAFAGTGKPKVPSNAFLMIHNPWTIAEGNAKDLRKMADDLDQIATGILNIYEEHLKEGVSIETIKELMDAETWLNGEQAAEYFDIEVGETQEYVAAVGDYLSKSRNMPRNLKTNSDLVAAKLAAQKDEEARNKLAKIVLSGISKGE